MLFAILLGLSGCGSSGDIGSPGTAASKEIRVTSAGLSPKSTVIDQGTRVLWANETQQEVIIHSFDALWEEQDLGPSESFSHSFRSPGTYPYSVEGGVRDEGTIEVNASSGGTPSGPNVPPPSTPASPVDSDSRS